MSVKLIGVKTSKGVYITEAKIKQGYRTYLSNYLFNGKQAQKTNRYARFFVPGEIKEVTKSESQPNINHRWILQDEALASENIPLVLREAEARYQDDDGDK